MSATTEAIREATVADANDPAARRARARRMALLLAVVAVVFYGAFLWFQVNQSRSRPPSRDWVPAPAATPAADSRPAPSAAPAAEPAR